MHGGANNEAHDTSVSAAGLRACRARWPTCETRHKRLRPKSKQPKPQTAAAVPRRHRRPRLPVATPACLRCAPPRSLLFEQRAWALPLPDDLALDADAAVPPLNSYWLLPACSTCNHHAILTPHPNLRSLVRSSPCFRFLYLHLFRSPCLLLYPARLSILPLAPCLLPNKHSSSSR